ncbi:hypothetical protein ACFVVC_01885 [Pseudarthrobacter sp. NPDC058196]|uniref:hypothetical protein n=1 Tax=Pseudarthrobacter sp. NPDC058196 TaxID=3346376 RepID=UPI0036DE3B66
MRDPRHDLGIPEDRAAIFHHAGLILSQANLIDARLVQLGSLLSDPKDANANRARWAKMNRAVEERKAIARELPESWQHGAPLVEGVRRCFDYRNAFAHASLDFELGGPPEYHVKWSCHSVSNSGAVKVTPIDLSVFRKWELRFEALNQALKYLLGPGRFFVETQDLTLAPIDLRGALLQGEHDDWSLVPDDQVDLWQETVEWLFPTAVYADAEYRRPGSS